MAPFEWIFVVFGAVVAFAGSRIQLHPERVVILLSGSRQSSEWQFDPVALTQIRMLGASFLFMGVFFALQMAINLSRLPWWMGTISGLVTATSAVALVHASVRHQQRKTRQTVQQSPLPKKVLELR